MRLSLAGGSKMWRLIKFFFTGDGHLHKWKFTHADYFSRSGGRDCHIVEYIKVCEICGKHKSGYFDNCRAASADELNL